MRVLLLTAIIVCVPSAAQGLTRVEFVDGAEVTIAVHPQKVVTVSVPELIDRVRPGVPNYKIDQYDDYVEITVPFRALATNLVIWTASGQHVVVHLRRARSIDDAEDMVVFGYPSMDLSPAAAKPVLSNEPQPQGLAKESPRDGGSNRIAIEAKDKDGFSLAVAPTVGWARNRVSGGEVSASPTAGLNLCGEIGLSDYGVYLCVAHTALSQVSVAPAECHYAEVQEERCEAETWHKTYTTGVDLGAAISFRRGSWVLNAGASFGVLAQYSVKSWHSQYTMDGKLALVERSPASYWRLLPSGGVGIGGGYAWGSWGAGVELRASATAPIRGASYQWIGALASIRRRI